LLSAALSSVLDFASPLASFPQSGLTADARGNLFGVGGGGTQIFEVVAGSNVAMTLLTVPAGTTITSGVTLDASGNIYAAAQSGGEMGDNYLFELPAGATAITRLATLDSDTGVDVQGRMAFDAAGNLYAAAGMFGPNSSNWAGTLVELPKGAGSVQVLAVFDAGAAGSDPVGVTIDAQGNLFGVCEGGGLPAANGDPAATDAGAVWELPAGSHTLIACGTFDDDTGYAPQDQVVVDSQGNLFGTCVMGGPTDHTAYANFGDVWEIPAGTDTLTVLVGFDGTNGCYPRGGLTMDAAGNLFGTTSGDSGGNLYVNPGVPTNGNGTVFEIAAGTATLTTLATFDASTGQRPQGELALDGNGNLFGVTVQGGSGHGGNLFEVTGSGAVPFNPSPAPRAASLTSAIVRNSAPSSAIAGQALHAQMGVSVSNSGSMPERGTFTVTFYASSTGSLDGSAVSWAAVQRRVNLRPGASTTIRVPLARVPAGLAGTFYLVTRTTDPNGAVTTASAANPMTIAPATMSLTEALSAPRFLSSSVGTGQHTRAVALLTITNTGNVPVTAATVSLFASPSGSADDAGHLALAIMRVHLNLRPGASRTVWLPLRGSPAGLVEGQYVLLAQTTDSSGNTTTALANPAPAGL
jgi:hypothetical protein